MLIIKYNPDNTPLDDLLQFYKSIKEAAKEEVLFLPAQLDYLQNATVEDLIDLRNQISTIITTKLSSDIQNELDKDSK